MSRFVLFGFAIVGFALCSCAKTSDEGDYSSTPTVGAHAPGSSSRGAGEGTYPVPGAASANSGAGADAEAAFSDLESSFTALLDSSASFPTSVKTSALSGKHSVETLQEIARTSPPNPQFVFALQDLARLVRAVFSGSALAKGGESKLKDASDDLKVKADTAEATHLETSYPCSVKTILLNGSKGKEIKGICFVRYVGYGWRSEDIDEWDKSGKTTPTEIDVVPGIYAMSGVDTDGRKPLGAVLRVVLVPVGERMREQQIPVQSPPHNGGGGSGRG